MAKSPAKPASKAKRSSIRFCEACQVTVPAGSINWHQHLHGKKHLTNVQLRSGGSSGGKSSLAPPPNSLGLSQSAHRPPVPRLNKTRPSAAGPFRNVSPVGRQVTPNPPQSVDSYRPMYTATTMGPRTAPFSMGHSRRSSVDSYVSANISQGAYSGGNQPGQMPAAGYKVTAQPLKYPKGKPPQTCKPISLKALFPYDPQGLDYSKIG